MARFRDAAEFAPTLAAAAEQLRISATAVEKDYWVSEVLRCLVSGFRDDFIFKGGTSLSKCYRLIKRFSEDVDILVLPGTRGRGAVDTVMKAMAAAAADGVGGEATAVGASETGRHRAYEIRYPATRPPTALIRTSVLLEMGVRGGPQPNQQVEVTCLLGDALAGAGTDLAEFSDLAPFEVAVLHPGRTLLEKLVIAETLGQQLAADPSAKVPARHGRHFYDIYELLGDSRVLDFLADRDQVAHVLADVEDVNRRYFADGLVDIRPPGGFADCRAFDVGCEVSVALKAYYEGAMPELYFGAGPLPSWAAICERVAGARQLL